MQIDSRVLLSIQHEQADNKNMFITFTVLKDKREYI